MIFGRLRGSILPFVQWLLFAKFRKEYKYSGYGTVITTTYTGSETVTLGDGSCYIMWKVRVYLNGKVKDV